VIEGAGSGWGTTPRRTARRIVREALALGLRPGDRLAAEPALIDYFGVSRLTMRNALALLGFLGAVEVVAGKHGGTRVAAPTADPVVSSLGMVLQHADADLGSVIDALAVIAPAIAALAAEHGDADAIAALRRRLDEIDPTMEAGEFVRAGHRFHIAIGHASGNPALAVINEALARITALEPLEQSLPQRRALRAETAAIFDAIAAGDAARAHAVATEAWHKRVHALTTRHRAVLSRSIEWPDVDELLDHRSVLPISPYGARIEGQNGHREA
jgi:DNA-binding FadR family transcriptional regulator